MHQIFSAKTSVRSSAGTLFIQRQQKSGGGEVNVPRNSIKYNYEALRVKPTRDESIDLNKQLHCKGMLMGSKWIWDNVIESKSVKEVDNGKC